MITFSFIVSDSQNLEEITMIHWFIFTLARFLQCGFMTQFVEMQIQFLLFFLDGTREEIS